MKQLLGTAVLLLLTSLPAYAQASLGSSLNSGGGHHLPSYPVLSNSVTYSTGPSEFTPWRPGPIAISISLKSSIIGPSLPFTDINDSMVSTRRPLTRSVGVFAFAGKGSLSARRNPDAQRVVPKFPAPAAPFQFGTQDGRPRSSNSPSSGRWVYGRNCKQRYLVTMDLQRLCKLLLGAFCNLCRYR